MKTHLLLAASLVLAMAADAQPLISISRTRSVKRAGPPAACSMVRDSLLTLNARTPGPGGGNFSGSISLKPEDSAHLLEILEKFLAWEKIARDNQAEPFTKEIGGLADGSNAAHLFFRWVSGAATMEVGPMKFESGTVAAFVDMLRNDLPGVEKEFAERTAKSVKEDALFK